jgi:DNA-directed RNA polymerase specialized sigma24 family protein
MATPAQFPLDPHASFIAALLQGNHRAWARLDQEVRPYLAVCLSRRGVRDPLDRDDLIQDTLIRVRARLETYRGQTLPELRSWMAAISYHILVDWRRGGRPTLSLDARDPAGEYGSTLADRLACPGIGRAHV